MGYNKFDSMESLGVYYWYVKMSRCGCVEHHGLSSKKCSTFGGLSWSPVFQSAARGVGICENRLLDIHSQNFNSATNEVWEWIGNCIPHFDMDRAGVGVVRFGRWRGEGVGVNSTADIGCFQESLDHCGLLDLAYSSADKHSQQISSQTFPSQFFIPWAYMQSDTKPNIGYQIW